MLLSFVGLITLTLETDTDEMSVVNAHLNDLPDKFSVCQDKLPTMY